MSESGALIVYVSFKGLVGSVTAPSRSMEVFHVGYVSDLIIKAVNTLELLRLTLFAELKRKQF